MDFDNLKVEIKVFLVIVDNIKDIDGDFVGCFDCSMAFEN